MSETEIETHILKPKICKLAIFSLVFPGLFAALCLPLTIGLTDAIVACGGCLLGIASGLAAIWKIDKSNAKLTGRIFAIAGVTFSIVLIPLILKAYHRTNDRSKFARRIVCALNLKQLGLSIMTYTAEFEDVYPTAENWCDLLLQHTEISEKQFVCRDAVKKGNQGPCHYAMNPNCEPNSPPDTVLLFETKGGWNQYGGPELLTFENHNGNGCNILFNDGRVEFIEPNELGKLRWKDEGGNKDSQSQLK